MNDNPDSNGFQYAWDQESIAEVLSDLHHRATRGEDVRIAMRVFRTDGSFEDVVLGGTEEDREEARRTLKKHFDGMH